MLILKLQGVGAKWGFGQPDNESGEEFCAVLDLNLDGGLADENCNSTYPYMCRFSGKFIASFFFGRLFHLFRGVQLYSEGLRKGECR